MMNSLYSHKKLGIVYKRLEESDKGNTTIIEAPLLGSGCGWVVYRAGRKAKWMVLHCINGVGSSPVEGRTTFDSSKI
jgi:hypothetical protein